MMAGYGDELIATGLARGATTRGKRIAFGQGGRQFWGRYSAEIFRYNPNIAALGTEHHSDVEWINYRKGHRIYNSDGGDHWIWNYNFNPRPGELVFDEAELNYAETYEPGFVVIEPNVEWQKPSSVNKDWGAEKYQIVAEYFNERGYEVCQFSVGKIRLKGVRTITTPNFRCSMAVLARAALVITPEGGLHHGAAAVGTKAIVLFGGWVPPGATGYKEHINFSSGGEACGRYKKCDHCRAAMDSIPIPAVIGRAESALNIEVMRKLA